MSAPVAGTGEESIERRLTPLTFSNKAFSNKSMEADGR